MFVERNEFALRFGTGKVALALWREYLQQVGQHDKHLHARVLTDVSGPAYTLIVELLHETFADAEPAKCRLVQRPDWREFYQKFMPLCERASRTYYQLQLEL